MKLKSLPQNFRVNLPRNIRHQWDLISCLVDRNIKVQYKRSSLGVLWMLIRLFYFRIYGSSTVAMQN